MNQETQHQVLKVILHAPTATALERARANAANLKRADPSALVRIVANGPAVATALDVAHAELDPITWVCPNTLTNTNRENRAPLKLMDVAAVLEIARLQRDGWTYMRS